MNEQAQPAELCFIMTRHVTNAKADRYWQHSLQCIRALYPTERVVIIDDASPFEPSTLPANDPGLLLVASEWPGRGELLPWLYFHLNPGWGEIAVFMHDSVFIKRRLPPFPVEY